MTITKVSTILTRVGVTESSPPLTLLPCESSPTETTPLSLLSPHSETLSPVPAGRGLTGVPGTLSHTMGGHKERLSPGHQADRLGTKPEVLDTALQSPGDSSLPVRHSTNIGIVTKELPGDAAPCPASHRVLLVQLQHSLCAVPLDMHAVPGTPCHRVGGGHGDGHPSHVVRQADMVRH